MTTHETPSEPPLTAAETAQTEPPAPAPLSAESRTLLGAGIADVKAGRVRAHKPARKAKPKPPPERRGGVREGSGRKPKPKREKLSHPTYVSMTQTEYRQIEKQAAAQELSVSLYIRKRLRLSTKV